MDTLLERVGVALSEAWRTRIVLEEYTKHMEVQAALAHGRAPPPDLTPALVVNGVGDELVTWAQDSWAGFHARPVRRASVALNRWSPEVRELSRELHHLGICLADTNGDDAAKALREAFDLMTTIVAVSPDHKREEEKILGALRVTSVVGTP